MRKVLLYFAYKYKGNWKKIYKALENKEKISEGDLDKVKEKTDFVTIIDKDYPKSLKKIHQPPFILFYKGDKSLLNAKNILAVIGSRDATPRGEDNTKKIINDLQSDFVIVSGMARGIDAVAHQKALDQDRKTIAVLGTGINHCYPNENLHLYEDIIENGLIISEYPGSFEGERETFKARNRLISGLSKGVVIIEAKRNSGTMNTAKHALDQNKDIFCVPSSDLGNSGNNVLIKEGASLIENASDIINDLF